MSEKRLLDTEHVARAIFLPAMLDSSGNVSLAAFTLRHNEGYYSVARMAIEGWLDDINIYTAHRFPKTYGYFSIAEFGYSRFTKWFSHNGRNLFRKFSVRVSRKYLKLRINAVLHQLLLCLNNLTVFISFYKGLFLWPSLP